MMKSYVEKAKDIAKNGFLSLGLGTSLIVGNIQPTYLENKELKQPIIEKCYDGSYLSSDGKAGAFFSYEGGFDVKTRTLEEMIVMRPYFHLEAEQKQALETQNYETGNNPNNSYSLDFLMNKQYESLSNKQNFQDFIAKHYSINKQQQNDLTEVITDLNKLLHTELFVLNNDNIAKYVNFNLCTPNISKIPVLYESIAKIKDVINEYELNKTFRAELFTAEQYETMIGESISELVLIPGNNWGDLVLFLEESTNTDEPEKSTYSFNVGISIGPDYNSNTSLIEDELVNSLLSSISNALPAKLLANLESKRNTSTFSPEESMKKIQNTIDSHYNNMSKTEKENNTNKTLQKLSNEQENQNSNE